jgi:6-phospho-beta-glucosidase
VVESFGTVDALGIRPMVTPNLPAPIRQMVLEHVRAGELTVRAGLTGDRALLREALAADPLARQVRRLDWLAERLLEAHRPLLPRFFGGHR